jgi:hypothetical protein
MKKLNDMTPMDWLFVAVYLMGVVVCLCDLMVWRPY